MKQGIHFNHQFLSVYAWSTKQRKAGHLHEINRNTSQKQYKCIKLSQVKIWMEIGGGRASKNLDKKNLKKART